MSWCIVGTQIDLRDDPSVHDITDLEDGKRNQLQRMDNRKMYVFFPISGLPTDGAFRRRDVAAFVNSYSTLEVEPELGKGEYTAGAPIVLQVALSRDADEDDEEDQRAVAPFYPFRKMANWWAVVGEPSTRQLFSVKRATIKKSLNMKLVHTTEGQAPAEALRHP